MVQGPGPPTRTRPRATREQSAPTVSAGDAAAACALAAGVHRHLFPPHEPMQVIALEDIAEFALLAFGDPGRFAGRTLELAGDEPTPVQAAAAITQATGLPVRYEQFTDAEAAAISPGIAEIKKRWEAGQCWHADIEALRVIHPGLRTLTDWLAESGAASIRTQLTTGSDTGAAMDRFRQ